MKGETVILYEKVKTGINAFGEPIFEEKPVEVEDVLIGLPTTTEVLDNLQIHGKKLVYTLGIPKKDDHNWKDAKIEFYGETFHSFGMPMTGNQKLIPMKWGTNVMVEHYEF